MSRTRHLLGFIVALAIVPAPAAAQGNGGGQGRRHYQEHDRATSTTFTATGDAAGNAVITLKGGDFALEKVLAHTGDATLRLSQGKDVVTIAISQGGFQIGRGSKTVRLDPRTDNEATLAGVRGMLLGSQAVRSFKRLVAALEARDEGEEDGPLALSALVDGAIVHLLDGDADAPKRIARRITRQQRATHRVVKAARAPGQFIDCLGYYQVSLLDAYGDYERCWVDASQTGWWTTSFMLRICEWEWAIRSQQYIWQFVGCFMLPW